MSTGPLYIHGIYTPCGGVVKASMSQWVVSMGLIVARHGQVCI